MVPEAPSSKSAGRGKHVGNPSVRDPSGGDLSGGDLSGGNPSGGNPSGRNPSGRNPSVDDPSVDTPSPDTPAAVRPLIGEEATQHADDVTAADQPAAAAAVQALWSNVIVGCLDRRAGLCHLGRRGAGRRYRILPLGGTLGIAGVKIEG